MHPQSVVWTINSHRALLIVVARNDVSVLVCFVKVNNRDQVTAFGWLEILQGMCKYFGSAGTGASWSALGLKTAGAHSTRIL